MKHLLFLFFILIALGIFTSIDIDGPVFLSFIGSAIIIFFILFYHLYLEKAYSPFLSAYLVFNFLFFIVAPLTQISFIEQSIIPEFVTKFPYKKELVLQSNFLITLFNGVFILAYIFFKKYLLKPSKVELPSSTTKVLPITILSILAISLLVLIISFGFVLYEIGKPSWQRSIHSVFTILIWKKVLFLLPFSGIVLCVQYLRKKAKKPINWITIIAALLCFFILLLWFKNPLIEKRNALGPIYICLIILFFPKLLKSNVKMLGFLFMIMIVAFPLSAVFTHTSATFVELLKDPSILITETNKGGGFISAFNTLNYDAFANIVATIEYVQVHGMSMGYQWLSAFLFFVPRGVWATKPISTGELVGNYLIDQYQFNFNNLSNPMVSEGYINFGVLGVVIMAVFLAIITVKFMKWLQSPNYLKNILAYYLAIHFIFLLRGDFTNGFSYFIGTLIGVMILPKLIEYLWIQLFRKQKQWIVSKK